MEPLGPDVPWEGVGMSADDKVNVAFNVRDATFLRRDKRSMGTQTRIHNMVGVIVTLA